MTDWRLLAAIAIALALLAIQSVRLAWSRGRAGRAIRQRAEVGADGELRASELLQEHGYSVIGRQVTQRWKVHVDGDAMQVVVRADFIVSNGTETFVAEVKTGREAPRVQTAATRRQLLEYSLAFDVGGVLLVDPEANRIRRVVFVPERAQAFSVASSRRPSFAVASLCLFAGVAIGIVLALNITPSNHEPATQLRGARDSRGNR